MLKMPIIGTVSRIEPNKIIVRCGDRVDTYNPQYYRIVPEQVPENMAIAKTTN